VALFVAEALDVERLHRGKGLCCAGIIVARVFIGEWGLSVRGGGGYCGHVTGRVWCCNYWFCGCWPVEIPVFRSDCVELAGQV
jgi:hypothetical protein